MISNCKFFKIIFDMFFLIKRDCFNILFGLTKNKIINMIIGEKFWYNPGEKTRKAILFNGEFDS